MIFDASQRSFHVTKLSPHCQGERWHRTFHALQHIHTEQVDQAFLTVCLPEEALATADFGAVFLIVGSLLMWKHVTQRRIGREIQPANLQVDVTDRAKLPSAVHVSLDVDWLQPVREASGLSGAVVFLNMLARPGNREQIEKREIVKANHFDETGWRPLRVIEVKPAVELLLCQACRAVDAADTVIHQGRVVALGRKRDLVA